MRAMLKDRESFRGESICKFATKNTQALYPGQSYVKGFKIDLRFIVDSEKTGVRPGAGEIAKDDTVDKLFGDEGKLVREAKDVVDHLLLSLPAGSHVNIMGGMLQITCKLLLSGSLRSYKMLLIQRNDSCTRGNCDASFGGLGLRVTDPT